MEILYLGKKVVVSRDVIFYESIFLYFAHDPNLVKHSKDFINLYNTSDLHTSLDQEPNMVPFTYKWLVEKGSLSVGQATSRAEPQ